MDPYVTPSIKLQPPTWDSNKRDGWTTFATDFESFVEYTGGETLVDLLRGPVTHDALIPTGLGLHALPTVQAHPVAASPAQAEAAPPADDPERDENLPDQPRELNSLADLTAKELALDRRLYHVLKLSIKGPGHDLILHVPQKSFTLAFGILQKEFGAATCLRKTELINSLFKLSYDGQIPQFKQKSLALLRDIAQANVTLSDVITTCLLRSFDGEDFQGFKLLTAKRVDDGEDINHYDFIQSICNSAELALTNKSASQALKVNSQQPRCTRCGGKTHVKSKCYAKKHVDGHQLTDRAPAKPPQRKPRNDKNDKNDTKESTKLSDLLREIPTGSDGQVTLDQVKSAVAKAKCLTVRQDTTPRICVLDSGSGEHLAAEVEVDDPHHKCAISGFDGVASSTSEGSGTLSLLVETQDSTPLPITLQPVHRINNLPEDILSLARLIEDGYEMHAHSIEEVYLKTPDGSKIPIRVDQGILFLDQLQTQTSDYVRSKQRRLSWKQLHSKLGHISKQALIDTVHNTYGLTADTINFVDFFCPTCALAKSSRKRISRSRDPDTLATRPFERIYTDVKTLKMDSPSKGNIIYYVIFNDEFSDFIAIFPLTKKTDVYDRLRTLSNQLDLNKLDYPVSIVSDGDGIYGQPFTTLCEELNLHHDPIAPYTPEHNKAERAIQAIDSRARALLIDAPWLDFYEFYYLASEHSAYLHNRTVGTRGKTPYELVKGQQPPIDHLIPFGCRGYLHADKRSGKRGNKLPPGQRSERVTMVGFRGLFSNQWRVMDHTGRITPSIHVDWDEDNHGIEQSLSGDHLEAILNECGFDTPGWLTDELNAEESAEDPKPPASPSGGNSNGPVGNKIPLDQLPRDMTLPEAFVQIPALPNPETGGLSVEKEGLNLRESVQANHEHSDNDLPDSDENPNQIRTRDYVLAPRGTIPEIDTRNIIDAPRRHSAHVNALGYGRALHVTKEISAHDALTGPDRVLFKEAIDKETQALLEHTVCPIDENHPEWITAVEHAVPSRYVLTKKRDGRCKARWVVQGFHEPRELDDISNHSHVATCEALRMLAFRSDRKRRVLASLDVKTAFLQSNKYKPEEPPRWIKVLDIVTGKWKYYRLLGPMYGQRSAPIRWEHTLAPKLVSVGFQQGLNDPSVFYRAEDDLTVIVYVDDLLIDGDASSVDDFIAELRKTFQCNEPVYLTEQQPIDFIGIIISLDSTSIHLSMADYHLKLLARMGMENCNPIGSPISSPIQADSSPLDEEAASKYREGVGSIGWLSSTVRPDLAFVFSRLGQHLAAPTKDAFRALKHVMRYIKGTIDYSLSAPLNDKSSNQFSFYTDSDHAADSDAQERRKSQTGIIALMNGTPIKWKSTKQAGTTLSSTEAEIYAASTAVQEFIHLGYVASELGFSDFPSPFTLFIDNAAAEIFMNNTAPITRMKHIDVRAHWVKEMRDQQRVTPCHIASADNLADLFTKIHPKTVFARLAGLIMTRVSAPVKEAC